MSNLAVRILFAVVAIPVAFFCLWWNDISRFALVCFMCGAGAWEWTRMVSQKVEGPKFMLVVAPIATVALVLAWAFGSGRFFQDFVKIDAVPGLVGFVAMLVMIVYMVVAYVKIPVATLFPWWTLQLGAPLYLGLWGGLNVLLLGSGHGLEHSFRFIVVMVSMWVCDTFAYFVGKFIAGRGVFGKHPMAPEISPKKTWEGFMGGVVFTVLWFLLWTTGGVYEVFECARWEAVLVGILLSVAGQAGDLLMSALKRWTGTKDSSHIFPGHGGVLDRMDSLFFAGPISVLLLWFLRGGV